MKPSLPLTSPPPVSRRRLLNRLNQEPSHVRWARQARGETIANVAAAIGKGESLVTEIERGTRNATPEVLAGIARYLGCPISMLERRVRPEWSELAS
jgi:transcriptional regulator with XRE-family HTH domain